jgi:hypothetical protein
VIHAAPKAGWKFTTWAGACKGSAPSCSLRASAASRVGATFAGPGSEANPLAVGTPAVFNDQVAKWKVTILGSQLQGDDLIVQVQATPLTVTGDVAWTFGLADWMFVKAVGSYGSVSALALTVCPTPSTDLRNVVGISRRTGLALSREGRP